MNDCIWAMTCICDCDNYRCENFISIDSKEGQDVMTFYQDLIDRELKVIRKITMDRFFFDREATK